MLTLSPGHSDYRGMISKAEDSAGQSLPFYTFSPSISFGLRSLSHFFLKILTHLSVIMVVSICLKCPGIKNKFDHAQFPVYFLLTQPRMTEE